MEFRNDVAVLEVARVEGGTATFAGNVSARELHIESGGTHIRGNAVVGLFALGEGYPLGKERPTFKIDGTLVVQTMAFLPGAENGIRGPACFKSESDLSVVRINCHRRCASCRTCAVLLERSTHEVSIMWCR